MKDKKKEEQLYPPLPLSFENTYLVSTDPFGMYTGRPLDIYDKPVQDADDL